VMMYRYYLLLFFLFAAISSQAQADFNGLWKGIITQNEGGHKSEYPFELYLHQTGNKVVGRSYVFDDGIYAEMNLKGMIYNGKYLRFQEIEIVDFTVSENMEWCIKSGNLVVQYKNKTAYLTGTWKGSTSFSECIPGRIELKKEIIRASINN